MAIKPFSGITPTLADTAFVDPSAILYGDITLYDDASIWPLVAARGDVNQITIGARSNVQDGSVLHVTRRSDSNPDGYPLIIGEDVTVGHKAMLHGCIIRNRVLVGMGAIVLDGAVIEDDVILGAGSLVPPGKTLQSGYLYVGSPAKQARPLNDKELAFLAVSAANYVKLKNEYLGQA
ncbi:Carbonic anhydrase or acetyltransferase, isoleucine patch superfamily [Ferrimonas sediminum]|uniref:Carbonic anhydrase or acetyltransferase, isoleucine patch superfamily n=1 Tax=Ferrimonas sediminum TaxID=718193 RepID=A0A1G9ACR2_9GAMM|nr:gamma carbonic anhydrase family protein [Ferrimonas sediminum]SDK24614.1 Carbonic anhydrase or acetyltransferase, isoleucine patch superfamily [Ferrimonas sediminum]